ncbi:MAG: HAMP domain-containing histidine kinase [Erysipelotrichaceae bacterium]|nr:HAMP domain-containing histidine kinase [Erysipelotrichaceae bacterium]
MIHRLRRNFIAIAMLSTLVVLTIIIGSLNIINYINLLQQADEILTVLSENDASFPDYSTNTEDLPSSFNVETPFNTRFFSVTIDNDLNVSNVDTKQITAIDDSTAIEYASNVIMTNNTSGFYDNYRYKVVEDDSSYMVIFVDESKELNSFHQVLFTSIMISLIGFAAVSILIIIFSKRVFEPVEESYHKQKQFITDASHELKTPLTIISANIDVLEMVNEENNWTDSIRHQISRLTTMVNQMVSLSRIDEIEELTNLVDFSLSDTLQECIDPFYEVATSQHKELLVDIENQCNYKGDQNMMKQMINLIMDNAFKYSNDNGTIKIQLKKTNKHYLLTFYNTTNEIPQGNLDQIFERFYRLDASRNSKTGGSGIGLSIVKSIVDVHKGSIHAKSEDGKSMLIEIKL